MRTSDLVIFSVILYLLRLPPAILFLIWYRGRPWDPMATLLRIVMGALILTASSRTIYVFDAHLMEQFRGLILPVLPAAIDLFGSAVWCGVAWALYLLFEQYRKEA